MALPAKKLSQFSSSSVLAKAGTTPTPSSKSKVPVVEVPDNTKAEIARARVVKDVMDSAKAEYEQLEASIFDIITPKYHQICRTLGYVSSVAAFGSDNARGTFSWKEQFAKNYDSPTLDKARAIAEALGGEEAFDRYMILKRELVSKETADIDRLVEVIKLGTVMMIAQQSDAMRGAADKLVAAVEAAIQRAGQNLEDATAEELGRSLDVITNIVPNTRYSQEEYNLPEEVRDSLAALGVKRYKPAMRVK